MEVPQYCYSQDDNNSQCRKLIMMNQAKTNIFRFDTDSLEILFDTGASSCAIPDKNYFFEGTHIKLKGVTIHGIAAGVQALGYRIVKWPIHNNKGKIVYLHLE